MFECGKADRPPTAWVTGQFGAGVTISAIRSLHGGESPWWVDLTRPDGSAFAAVLRSPSSRISAEQIGTNAAALTVAAEHGLPAPVLLAADRLGRTPVSLETVVPGTGAWPDTIFTDLLRSAGAAIARVHAVRLGPRPALPFRTRPIAVDDFALDRRLGRMPATALLVRADERVRSITPPDRPATRRTGTRWPP